MQTVHGQHASDEELERFALGGLRSDELTPFEEHLLLCEDCQERLIETDQFIRAIRIAAARLRATPAPHQRGFFHRFIQTLSTPAPVWALATATLVIVGFLVAWPGAKIGIGMAPPVAVMLETHRGIENSAHAPAGRSLELVAGLQGLPVQASYRIELVDAVGQTVWQITTSSRHEKLTAHFDGKLPSGQYWVRVYEPSPNNELLREFGLRLE